MNKNHPDNQIRPGSVPGALTVELEKAKAVGDKLLEEGKGLNKDSKKNSGWEVEIHMVRWCENKTSYR